MLVSTFGSTLEPYFKDNISNYEIAYKELKCVTANYQNITFTLDLDYDVCTLTSP